MLAHTLRRWTHSSITSGKKCSTSYSLHSFCSPGHSTSELSALSKVLRGFGSLPKHDVVGLPALSPTMEVGTIVKWNMKEGYEFGPGDVFADVETDKATIAFEAVDDGVLAKILVPEGVPDIPVGTPILVTVDEKEDVGAFADYKAEDISSSKVSKEPKHEQDNILKQDDSSVNAAPAVQILPTPPPSTTTTLPKSKSKPAPAVPVPHEKEDVTTTTSNQSTSRLGSILWGENIKNGPLYHRIRRQQVAYVARYGTTGTEIVD